MMNVKIRFQNYRFKQRLRIARQYKRHRLKDKPNFFFELLNSLGLSFWKTIPAILVFFALIAAAAYWPKLFFVKNISIQGADGSGQEQIKSEVKNFFAKSKKFPQQNLLLLSTDKLKNYLQTNLPFNYKIAKVSKKFPRSLVLEIQTRFEQYIISSPQNSYILFNDGAISQILTQAQAASSTEAGGLIKITLAELNASPEKGQSLLEPKILDNIFFLREGFSQKLKIKPNFFELADLKNSEAKISLEKKFSILLDLNGNLQQTLDKLALLLAEIPGGDKNRLHYIDIRFLNKAFVCLKGAACARVTDESSPERDRSRPTPTLSK